MPQGEHILHASVSDLATNTASTSDAVTILGSVTRAYVNHFDNFVFVIDVATNTVLTSISVGGTLFGGIGISPDGTRVYAARHSSTKSRSLIRRPIRF